MGCISNKIAQWKKLSSSTLRQRDGKENSLLTVLRNKITLLVLFIYKREKKKKNRNRTLHVYVTNYLHYIKYKDQLAIYTCKRKETN